MRASLYISSDTTMPHLNEDTVNDLLAEEATDVVSHSGDSSRTSKLSSAKIIPNRSVKPSQVVNPLHRMVTLSNRSQLNQLKRMHTMFKRKKTFKQQVEKSTLDLKAYQEGNRYFDLAMKVNSTVRHLRPPMFNANEDLEDGQVKKNRKTLGLNELKTLTRSNFIFKKYM